MTASSAADRPGASGPGTEPLRPHGSRADVSPDSLGPPGGDWQHPAAWPARTDDDTGPVPIVGGRPAPPSRPTEQVTAPAATPLPPDADADAADAEELATTERPVGGRAGRDLRAAIGVGVGLVAVIVASLFIWRPAFLAVLTVAILVAVVELTRALQA